MPMYESTVARDFDRSSPVFAGPPSVLRDPSSREVGTASEPRTIWRLCSRLAGLFPLEVPHGQRTPVFPRRPPAAASRCRAAHAAAIQRGIGSSLARHRGKGNGAEIGRASWRERVGMEVWGVAI